MQYKGYRLPVVLISLAVTVALLAGMALLSEYAFVRLPLQRALLAVEGVQGVRIEHGSGGDLILVQLADVPNLEKTYNSLYQTILAYEKVGSFNLKLLDNRNRELEEIYYRLNFSLQEAAATGQFSKLLGELDGLGPKVDRALAGIDNDNIYLQLHQGGHYLYQIVPRQPRLSSKNAGGGIWP